MKKSLGLLHVVLGNEACDMDSMVSAITFAYFLSKVSYSLSFSWIRFSIWGLVTWVWSTWLFPYTVWKCSSWLRYTESMLCLFPPAFISRHWTLGKQQCLFWTSHEQSSLCVLTTFSCWERPAYRRTTCCSGMKLIFMAYNSWPLH